MKLIANSAESLAAVVSTLKEMFHKKKYLRVTIIAGKDRSLDQNAIFHKWIAILEQKGAEFTFDGYRAFCRLHFFVPILRAENDEFREMYDRIIKPLPYQHKIDLLTVFQGISSICTTTQFSRALEVMQGHFATLTTNPVFLEFPEEDLK